MEIIFNRRSVRKFTDKPVEDEKLDKMLRRAMQAPSAMNQQPWEFLLIKQPETINRLSKFSPYSKLLEGAKAAVVFLEKNETKAPRFTRQDMGACVQNFLLEGAYLGLGCCWMGVGRGSAQDSFITDMFSLPQSVKPFAVVAVGYPADDNANKFVDRYRSDRVHTEKY